MTEPAKRSPKLEKKVKVEPKREPKGVLKRPAAGVKVEPKTKVRKLEPVEASAGTIMKSMPKRVTPAKKVAPVVYNGGIIYTSFAKRNFRALRIRGDNYSEQSARWKADQPTAVAWKTVVKSIDAARAAESAKRRKPSKRK